MRGLQGKVAVVVGAGNALGIGEGTARRLAQEGCSVVLADVNLSGAQANAEKINAAGGQAHALHVDLADEASVKQMVEGAVKRYGRIDSMFVNAADTNIRQRDFDAIRVETEVFDQTISIGLRGHLLCTRYCLPVMLENGGGTIIYTSSDAAFTPMGHYPSYNMAKAGVTALMRHVVTKWGKENIRANCISPGLILTDTVLRDHSEESKAMILGRIKSPRLGSPDDIAGMVAFLASDDAAWVLGQVISVNGGDLMRW